MPGLLFEELAPIVPSAPNRMDIALMVGVVRVRAGAALPAVMAQWLDQRGWTSQRYPVRRDQLLDIPIPIDSWDRFDQLFAWEQRAVSGNDGSTYFGAAVRSFFAQGGRRCYVVRAGDPTLLEDLRALRLQVLSLLLPGYPIRFSPAAADRDSWHGLGHLFGLPDVSLVCLPDLPELLSVDRTRVPLPEPPPSPAEIFKECSVELAPPPPDRSVRDVGAPRCDDQGYSDWAKAVNLVTSTIARGTREVEFVAAVPLPEQALNLAGTPLGQSDSEWRTRPQSAFLQLVFPWVTTPGSSALPENLEPPDGVMAGILARNALTQGTYRSAAGLHVGDIASVFPLLSREEQDRLEDHVCLIGPTPGGLKLLTDVTMSPQYYQPGSLSRLVSTLVRTARSVGEVSTFEPNGEAVWGEVQSRLNNFLLGLFHAGALRGSSPQDAFTVQCDRSTMTQNDLDSGRLIALVQISPAAPIDTITVTLVINEDRLTLAPAGGLA